MDILIVIGVAAMFAAVFVLGWLLEKTGKAAKELAAENSKLRNDLHACINARKAKSRGITGKYRKAIEAHRDAFKGARDGTPTGPIDSALWAVVDDSGAV